ncbi:multidrug effflux MFS transporter [Yimella sp. cx-51]|uniref:multidrug effflux MFS transporter n=1 Tax=Yimella sp. cx-51 TaxID=2770551 RepID=UPI001FCA6353|nr:multidrug effflux MFS transporter [Yimella sp. cx-51]
MTEKQAAGRLWLLLVVLASLSMLGPFSIDTPFPAFTRMGNEFAVDADQMQLVVTAYMLAFAAMSPFHGPISDAVGRRPVMLAGLSVYALASIGCALSQSLPMLLGFRVLQGLSAGGSVIVSRAVIRDMFEGAQAQRLMSKVTMIFGVAPAVAPIVGGWLLTIGSWRAIFGFLVVLAVGLTALVVFALPESHPPQRRTAFNATTLLGSLVQAGRSPAFHRVSWAASLSFAGQFLYIGAAPIFVVDLLGKGEQDFWMFFVPMITGVVLGSAISSWTSGRLTINQLVSGAMVFALFGAVVNLLLGVLPGTQSLPYAVIGPALIAIGTGASYPAFQLTLLDMFPATRGATVSLFTFFTLVLNGLAAGFIAPHVTGSLAAMALTALVAEILAMLFWVSHLRHRPGAGGRIMGKRAEPVRPT